MGRINKATIKEQIKNLGLGCGDVVFVSSDLMRVGYYNESPQQTMQDWMDIFQDILGPDGTIVIPTYSPSVLRFIKKNEFIYTQDSISSSGSLANAYISKSDGAIRSLHPATSCIALGKYAQEVVAKHGPGASAYYPYSKVIELGGKNLMLGTVDEKNCPMPFHYAQEILGHTLTHPLSGFLETAYLNDDGEKTSYIVREIGGCTRGVHKTWGYHLANNAVSVGQVGRSLSALVDARKSYDIMLRVLKNNPGLIKCDDKYCISCYGRYRYNGVGVFPYYLRKLTKIIGRFKTKS
ncbi:AAC(3) family N-acetyltransferase [Neptuniibacter sp. SY11_33]|uniref:AAC(3) family N-acetyltransferase n=1 Tax=Neptuniibacter sp. SY11_33 TaxID=3398215 RepID=UPI0039F4523C